jgi:putative membrane-bound dehydrogenase-like protein
MIRPLISAIVLLAAATASFAAEYELRGRKLRVPDGFRVRLVAEEPLVTYPICADFDERGRMYVCEASGSADWNKPQQPGSLHKVLRLVDIDANGTFDTKTVFAEFEMIPQGAMWLDGSLYVAGAPYIWKLTDTDDDGVADVREEWVKIDATTGCLNDLRGPYLGPDGYIYWSKGPSKQTYTVDGKDWTSDARHVMRRKPGAKDAEYLMVGGMDNVIEVAFNPAGERFVTCTLFNMLGEARDDGILHAVYGAVHPKDISPIFDFPWTGPDLMRPMTSWGAMSPAGLLCYESESFGKEYRGNLFSALFSGHKVLRHQLKPKGGTYECTNEDFLSCDNIEFHPTEVLEDADGSMIVIDTGGWYLRCCPSSTFYRPDVHGAIYRIEKVDAPKIKDPRGEGIRFWTYAPAELIGFFLDNPRREETRPVVLRSVINQLGKFAHHSIKPLLEAMKSSKSADARRAFVWASARIPGNEALDAKAIEGLGLEDGEDARAIARLGLDDKDATVRQAALNVVSLHRDSLATSRLKQFVLEGSPHEIRIAAEALGRIGDSQAVPTLLEALAKPADRFVEHALIYALIQIADTTVTPSGLDSENANVRRAVMIALDQMPGGKLDPQRVIAELSSPDARMQDTAWWIVSRHADEWGPMLAAQLRSKLADESATAEQRAALKTRLSQLARSPGLAKWFVEELTRAGVSASTRMLLLQAMGDAGGKEADPLWVETMLDLLRQSRETDLSLQLIATLGKLPPMNSRDKAAKQLAARLHDELLASAHNATLPPDARMKALSAVRDKSLGAIDDELFAFLFDQLAPEQPLSLRSSAAEALARAKLSDAQLLRLAAGLKNVSYSELNVLLPLFEGRSDAEIGRKLVNSLLGSSAATSLTALRARVVLAKFPESVTAEAAPFFARLEQAQGEQLAKAKRVLDMIGKADPQHGMQVFLSQKASCSACHKAAHVGGITGPHLKGVGTRRTERDIIESILFPSASLVQSYESWTVVTDDGRALNGVLLEDKPDEILISGGADKTFRLPRKSIEEMVRSETSIMPTGIDKNLSDAELADLVAFLKTL